MNQKIRMRLSAGLLCTAILLLTACGEEASPPPEITVPEQTEADTAPVLQPEPEAAFAEERKALEEISETPGDMFRLEEANGGWIVTAYLGSGTQVRVPEQWQGKPITGIGKDAFADRTELEILLLPDGILSIGKGILRGCTGLQALRTPLLGAEPGSEQFLGYLFGSDNYHDNARDVPAGLRILWLGGEASTLPERALFDCNDLQYLILPETVRSIGSFALYQCSSLLWIEHLDKVTSFAEYAMASCASLEKLTFGSNVTSMGFGMLFGCSSLSVLTLPFVGAGDGEHGFLAYLFGAESPEFAKGYYPTGLARVEILSSCPALENYAFYDCTGLKEVILPEGLTSVGVRAFAGCRSLWQIRLPDSLREIREYAFSECTALGAVAFGTGLQTVGIHAFYRCESLREISLPQSLTALPASAFAECLRLERVALGGVKRIGKNAFYHCVSIAEVSDGEDVTAEEGNECLIDRMNRDT